MLVVNNRLCTKTNQMVDKINARVDDKVEIKKDFNFKFFVFINKDDEIYKIEIIDKKNEIFELNEENCFYIFLKLKDKNLFEICEIFDDCISIKLFFFDLYLNYFCDMDNDFFELFDISSDGDPENHKKYKFFINDLVNNTFEHDYIDNLEKIDEYKIFDDFDYKNCFNENYYYYYCGSFYNKTEIIDVFDFYYLNNDY